MELSAQFHSTIENRSTMKLETRELYRHSCTFIFLQRPFERLEHTGARIIPNLLD